jgi:WD40 repeat protein
MTYIPTISEPEFFQLKGNNKQILAVCFSPDGKLLATGEDWPNILIHDLSTKKVIHELQGHTHMIQSICFSPDGKILASGGCDNKVILWDVQTGLILKVFTYHVKTVLSVCFSPNGKFLASAGNDLGIHLMNLITNEPPLIRVCHSKPIHSVCFSPDGSFLVSASTDGSVKLWDLKNRAEFDYVHIDTRSPCYSLAYSPDGSLLATGCEENLRLSEGLTLGYKGNLRGHVLGIHSICFSPDGKHLISGGSDMSIRIWNVVTQRLVKKISDFAGTIHSLNLSPNGQFLAVAASNQRSTIVYDFGSPNLGIDQYDPLDDILDQIPGKFVDRAELVTG